MQQGAPRWITKVSGRGPGAKRARCEASGEPGQVDRWMVRRGEGRGRGRGRGGEQGACRGWGRRSGGERGRGPEGGRSHTALERKEGTRGNTQPTAVLEVCVVDLLWRKAGGIPGVTGRESGRDVGVAALKTKNDGLDKERVASGAGCGEHLRARADSLSSPKQPSSPSMTDARPAIYAIPVFPFFVLHLSLNSLISSLLAAVASLAQLFQLPPTAFVREIVFIDPSIPSATCMSVNLSLAQYV